MDVDILSSQLTLDRQTLGRLLPKGRKKTYTKRTVPFV